MEPEHVGRCVKRSLQFLIPTGEQWRLLTQQMLHFGYVLGLRLLPGTLPSSRAQAASFSLACANCGLELNMM